MQKYKEIPKDLIDSLDYDSKSGALKWISAPKYHNDILGKAAGSPNSSGYILISHKRTPYLAHRIAWKKYYGVDSNCVLDHINGDRSDNRIDNLRESDHFHNNINRLVHRNGNSVGVTLTKANTINKYQANSYMFGKCKYIGRFNTKYNAERAMSNYNALGLFCILSILQQECSTH